MHNVQMNAFNPEPMQSSRWEAEIGMVDLTALRYTAQHSMQRSVNNI